MELTDWQFTLMADQLRNDEFSSDDELLEHFIRHGNIPVDVAEQAVLLRPAFLCDPRVQLTMQDNQLTVTPVAIGGQLHS